MTLEVRIKCVQIISTIVDYDPEMLESTEESKEDILFKLAVGKQEEGEDEVVAETQTLYDYEEMKEGK